MLLDQDPATSYGWPALSAESFDLSSEARLRGVTLLLGGRFLVREIRFRPLADRPDHFLEQFRIGISDADFNTFRVPWFPTLIEVRENTDDEVSVLLDPPVTTEAVQLRIIRDTPKEIGLADFEVYGGGFVGQAVYESDVIELDEIASWGDIRWSGRRDSLARVDIRTRIGSDPQPERSTGRPASSSRTAFKFLQGGGDLSLAEYKRQYGRFSDFLKPMLEEDRATPDTEELELLVEPLPVRGSRGRDRIARPPQVHPAAGGVHVYHRRRGQNRLRRVQGLGAALRPPPRGRDSSDRDHCRRADPVHLLHPSDDPFRGHRLRRGRDLRLRPGCSRSTRCASGASSCRT